MGLLDGVQPKLVSKTLSAHRANDLDISSFIQITNKEESFLITFSPDTKLESNSLDKKYKIEPDDIKKYVIAKIKSTKTVIIDMENVCNIDQDTAGVLLGLWKELQRQGMQAGLHNLQEDVYEKFERFKLTKLQGFIFHNKESAETMV